MPTAVYVILNGRYQTKVAARIVLATIQVGHMNRMRPAEFMSWQMRCTITPGAVSATETSRSGAPRGGGRRALRAGAMVHERVQVVV